MLLARLVVQQCPALHRPRQQVESDDCRRGRLPVSVRRLLAGRAGARDGGRQLQQIQRDARVAVRVLRHRGQGSRGGLDRLAAQPALRIAQRPLQNRLDFGCAERAEDEHPRA